VLQKGRPSAFLVDDAAGGRRAPVAGEVFRNPDLAAVLEELSGGKAAFYEGRIAHAIVEAVQVCIRAVI
jgi:gamma-glutamyltranspeptidase / glutathione hydrolase